MKANIKTDFERKMSTRFCRDLKDLSGQKWTMPKIREIINSTDKYYLNEIGRKFMLDGNKVKYDTANYMLAVPRQFITSTGEQLYVWLYRESTDVKFGKINIDTANVFDYAVVKNYYTKTKNVKQSNI